MIDHTKTIEALTLELDRVNSKFNKLHSGYGQMLFLIQCMRDMERSGGGVKFHKEIDEKLFEWSKALSTITTGEDNDRT